MATTRSSSTPPTSPFNAYANPRNNFGFQTYFPRNINIDGLTINDGNRGFLRGAFNFTPPFIHVGPTIFGPMHLYGNDALFVTLLWDTVTNYWFNRPPYAPVPTERITLNNVEIESGRRLTLSKNIFRFCGVRISKSKAIAKPKPSSHRRSEKERFRARRSSWNSNPDRALQSGV